MPYRLCACNLEHIENNSNHFLELCLTLWRTSNDVMSFRPYWPGTWFIIIFAWRTAKYQNYCPTCFSVMNALSSWIKIRHVRSDNPSEYWSPAGAAIMLEPFDSIHWRVFTPVNLLLKSDWNCWVRLPTSALKCSSAEVIDVYDSEDILYIQQYLVATSTWSRTYWWPPKTTQSQKNMSIWTFSRYWTWFFIGFTSGGLAMVEK